MFFQRIPILKVNLVEKMKRNTYSDVLLLVMHKTLPSFTAFTWFNSKSKMAIMFGDVTVLHQRHHTWNIPHPVEKIKGFPLKAKSFQNIATCLGRGTLNPAPSPVRGFKRTSNLLEKTLFTRLNSFIYHLGPSVNSAQTELQTFSPTYWPLGHWRMLKGKVTGPAIKRN